MIGMLVLVFFPFFYGIGLAFTDTTLFNESAPFRERWIGLGNFLQILGDFNIVTQSAEGTTVNYQNFYWTLMMTVIWTVTNVTVGVTFGFILALALNTESLARKSALPHPADPALGDPELHHRARLARHVPPAVRRRSTRCCRCSAWTPVRGSTASSARSSTGLVTNGWLSFPFMMVVILGALQSIPKDMYEAAEVEGATRWQQLKRITLPLLRPTLVPAIILSVVWTFNMFNIIFLVCGGEPGGANEILITKAYKIAFEQYQYAYAAAYSTVIFIILLVYGYFQTRMTRATESYLRRRRMREKTNHFWIHVGLISFTLLAIYPVLWVLALAFSGQQSVGIIDLPRTRPSSSARAACCPGRRTSRSRTSPT